MGRSMRTMRGLVVALAVIGAASAADAAEVYRWTDTQGRVHYGDWEKIPEARRASATPVDTSRSVLTGSQRREAAARAQKASEPRANSAPSPTQNVPPPVRSLGGPAPAAAAGPVSPEPQSCAERWQAYNASYACFDQYRVGGKVRPEGYRNCKEVLQPDPC